MQILSIFPAVVAVGIFGTVQGYELKPQLHARLSFPSFPNLHVFFSLILLKYLSERVCQLLVPVPSS